MRNLRRFGTIFLVALLVNACGSTSSPSGPSPAPQPGPVVPPPPVTPQTTGVELVNALPAAGSQTCYGDQTSVTLDYRVVENGLAGQIWVRSFLSRDGIDESGPVSGTGVQSRSGRVINHPRLEKSGGAETHYIVNQIVLRDENRVIIQVLYQAAAPWHLRFRDC